MSSDVRELWLMRTRAHRLSQMKARYVANREAVLDEKKAYHAANRDARNAATRAWSAANRERKATATKAWIAANPSRWKAISARRDHKRRALLLMTTTYSVTDRDWLRLCRRWDNRCAYCGAIAPLERDHVVPLSRGGQNSIGNLLPACDSCNSSKRNKFLVEWRHRDRSLV